MTFESRFPLWFFAVAALALLGNFYFAVVDPEGSSLFTMFVCLVGAAVVALGLYNRLRRPAVAIDAGVIAHGHVFQVGRSQVRASEVAEVLPDNDRKIVLQLKSGATRRIRIGEVAKAERDTARQAIVDAVAAASAAGG